MLFLEGKHVPALQTQTMKNFAAIDFETANQCHSSVCSVGVVVVRDGKVTDKFYSLIYPHPYFFSYWNTRVHGLTLTSVDDHPMTLTSTPSINQTHPLSLSFNPHSTRLAMRP